MDSRLICKAAALFLIYVLSVFSIGLLFAPIVPYLILSLYRIDYRKFSATALMCLVLGSLISSWNVFLFFLLAVLPAITISITSQNYTGTYISLFGAGTASGIIVFLLLRFLGVYFEQELAAAIENLYQSLNLSEINRLADESYFAIVYYERDYYAHLIGQILPAIAFVYASAVVYFTEKISFRIPPCRAMDIPDYWLGVLAIGLIFSAVPKINAFGNIGYLTLIVSASIYFFRGFDIVLYYFARWNFGLFFKVFFCVLVLMEMVLMALVAVLGLVSVYKNFIKNEDAA